MSIFFFVLAGGHSSIKNRPITEKQEVFWSDSTDKLKTMAQMAKSMSSDASVHCCFCNERDMNLVALSLRCRAFSHQACLESYFKAPCDYCQASKKDVGEKVMAINLTYMGHQQNVMGEVIAIHKDNTFTLCFADNNELARIDCNPDWKVGIVFGM